MYGHLQLSLAHIWILQTFRSQVREAFSNGIRHISLRHNEVRPYASLNHNGIWRIPYKNTLRTGLRNLILSEQILFFHFYCPVTWGWWVEESCRDNLLPPSSFSAIQSRYTCIMTVNNILFRYPPLPRAVIGLPKCSRCQDPSKIFAERQKQKVSQVKQEQPENRPHRTLNSGEPQYEYKMRN